MSHPLYSTQVSSTGKEYILGGEEVVVRDKKESSSGLSIVVDRLV
jgi:hypothetical protein